MGLFKTFDIAGSALSAQSLRLNLTASNLANMNNVAGSPDEAYRARHAVFRATEPAFAERLAAAGVHVLGVVESTLPALERFDPGHPEADENGLVYAANVSTVEEMANMLSASRAYQSNLEVINTAKQLMLRTLSMGRG